MHAMCAAPIALGHYGLLEGANYTCYQALKTIEEECPNGHFSMTSVVDQEHKIITSRGPATAWAYAYTIIGHSDMIFKYDLERYALRLLG